MPKPKNKESLQNGSREQFNRLIQLIDALSIDDQKKAFPQGTLNRNIRDVLSHVHHWNTMFLEWYKTGMSGVKPDMPAKGYAWKDLPELNKVIWKKYQKHSLAKSRKLLVQSFEDILKIVEKHSDEELYTKKKYAWTGSTSIGAYIASAIYSHNMWAYKLIKKATKK